MVITQHIDNNNTNSNNNDNNNIIELNVIMDLRDEG